MIFIETLKNGVNTYAFFKNRPCHVLGHFD